MKKDIKILYISNIYKENNIYFSQVNELLINYNNSFELKKIFISNYRENVENSIFLKAYKGNYIFIVQLICFIRNFFLIKKILAKFDADIIISRGLTGGLIGVMIKKAFFLNKKVLLINDVRGDIIDEKKMERKKYDKLFIMFIQYSLKKVLNNADIIFTVSNFLKERIAKGYGFKEDKIHVFPTIVPENKFFYSEDTRKEYRNILGLKKEEIVVVYSGSLNKWQNFEYIIQEFDKSSNDKLKLLILTGEIEKAKKIIDGLNHSGRIILKTIVYGIISKYLQACDYGLLIRDNNNTNLSASPTKFGEYINSGLCVIMNKIETDYYYQAKQNNLNVIIIDRKEELKECFDNLKAKPKNKYVQINTVTETANRQKDIFYKLIN